MAQLESLNATLAGGLRREQIAETSIRQLEAEIELLNCLVFLLYDLLVLAVYISTASSHSICNPSCLGSSKRGGNYELQNDA